MKLNLKRIMLALLFVCSTQTFGSSRNEHALTNSILTWEKETEIAPGKILYENIFVKTYFGDEYRLASKLSPRVPFACAYLLQEWYDMSKYPSCDPENVKDTPKRFCITIGNSDLVDYRSSDEKQAFHAFISKDLKLTHFDLALKFVTEIICEK